MTDNFKLNLNLNFESNRHAGLNRRRQTFSDRASNQEPHPPGPSSCGSCHRAADQPAPLVPGPSRWHGSQSRCRCQPGLRLGPLSDLIRRLAQALPVSLSLRHHYFGGQRTVTGGPGPGPAGARLGRATVPDCQ